VAHGSNINLQTASSKDNVTPLMQGAMKGNLDLVKTCVELGGKPDIRGTYYGGFLIVIINSFVR